MFSLPILYNQYVGSIYNDVFGFFINGVHAALIPGTSTVVSINTVNLAQQSRLLRQ